MEIAQGKQDMFPRSRLVLIYLYPFHLSVLLFFNANSTMTCVGIAEPRLTTMLTIFSSIKHAHDDTILPGYY
jgi:hypothetical protein